MTAKNGKLWKRVSKKEGKPLDAVGSQWKLRADISSINGKQNALVEKYGELGLEVQPMHCLTKEAKILCARVIELEKASKKKLSKMLP